MDKVEKLLESIDNKLDILLKELVDSPPEREDMIIDFLKNVTKELGIEDKVTIVKVKSENGL